MTLAPPARRTDLSVEEFGGELVLSDPRNGHVYRLNQTAAEIWRQCDGRKSTAEIAEHLMRNYEVESETALDHVEQITALFSQSDLIGESE
jgi:hypothetical protein